MVVGYDLDCCYLTLDNFFSQINTLIANGDKQSLRKLVTEQMYSVSFHFSFLSAVLLLSSASSNEKYIKLISLTHYLCSGFCLTQALKNEIKLNESRWSKVYWELIEPVVKIRTLRARMASISV